MTTKELSNYPIAHNLVDANFLCDDLKLYWEMPDNKVLELYYNEETDSYHIIGVSNKSLNEIIEATKRKAINN
jgi:hypothetical protein